MKYSKIIRINEIVWLIFAAVAIGITVYSIITKNQEQAIYFLALTFISGLFYAFKKKMRKRYEEREKNEKPT